MRRFFSIVCLTLLGAVWAAACGGDQIDGQVKIQLVWVCDPPIDDYAAQIDIYCVSVLHPGEQSPDKNCSSSLDGLSLKVNETSGMVKLEVVGLTSTGEQLVRGVSTPVRLVSGDTDIISVPMVPLGRFSMFTGDGGRCRPLPYYAVGHTATVFQSGFVLVAGSAAADQDPSRIAFLVNPATSRFVSLSTPSSLYRFQHSATLLDDGQLVLLGGQNQLGSAPQDVIVLRDESKILTKPYDKAVDYSQLAFDDLADVLMVPRARHAASLFYGNQVLVNDGQRTAEMWLGSEERSDFIAVDGVEPFPASGRVATVTPIDGQRALVFGGQANHNGLLSVQQGTRAVDFVEFGLQTAVRDGPVGIPLGDDLVMFMGGLGTAMIGEPPVVILDPSAPAIYEVPVDEPRFPQRGFSASMLPDGRVFVVGGTSASPQYVPGSTFLLEQRPGGDPTKWASSPGPPLMLPRAYHTASLLPDGRLLVIGGVAAGAAVTDQQAASSAEVIAF